MKLSSLTPMLETNDVGQTIRFYENVLGFSCSGKFPDDGQPTWASLCRDGIEIMFSARNEHRAETAAFAQPMLTGSLYLKTDDVDALWEQIKDKVTIEYPIESFAYGMREFAMRDCNGYLLQFGQELSETEVPADADAE